MRRRAILWALTVAALCAPATAVAAPPVNDDYLGSIPVNSPGTKLSRSVVKDQRDTTEATTQSDLFSPTATGGGPENLSCGPIQFGKTVWYDFHPDQAGAVEIVTGGFPLAVDVYEYAAQPPSITANLQCATGADAQDVIVPDVRKGHHYTIQIGGLDTGAGAASGMLAFQFQYFADTDRDGIFDPLDKCPTQPGVAGAGGCPPELKATATLTATPSSGGIVVRSLKVAATRGARVNVRCRRGCSFNQAHTAKTVRFAALAGKALPAGSVLEIFVTKARSIGAYVRYDIVSGNFKRTDRCLKPGSKKPLKRCK
jgi:hypothetical protein